MKSHLFRIFMFLSICNVDSAVWATQTLRSALGPSKFFSFVKNGKIAFMNRPYVEFRGIGGCHRKAMVSQSIFNRLQDNFDSKEVEFSETLAANIALIQPANDELYISPKRFAENLRTLTDVKISHTHSKKLCDDTQRFVTDSMNQIWQTLACHNRDVSFDEAASAKNLVHVLEESETNLFLAFYRGSPGLSDVVGHKFQHVYKATPKQGGGWSIDPGFNEDDIPCGLAPEADDTGIILHVGLPGQLLDGLGNDKFCSAFPNRKMFGSGTPVSKLNLPCLDLSKFIEYSFKLMELDWQDAKEPNLDWGMFRFPLSLYHFSFAPKWPMGGHKEYLGRPLDQHHFVDFRTQGYNHPYWDPLTHPLDISILTPNPFYGPLADIPGVKIRLRREGINYLFRLIAHDETLYSKDELMPGDKWSKTLEKSQTEWVWDLERTEFVIYKTHGPQKKPEFLFPSAEEVKKHWEIVRKSILTHYKLNFCLKTRWLLSRAGLYPQMFEPEGLLRDENILKFADNAKKRITSK